MPLASSIFVAFVGFAGILNQSVEGKPKVAMLRDGNSGTGCAPEVQVHSLPSGIAWSGIYKRQGQGNHIIYQGEQLNCIWWLDEGGQANWWIGSCDSMGSTGMAYLDPVNAPMDALCPYEGTQGPTEKRWKEYGTNDPINGYVTAIWPPSDNDHHVLHHVAHGVAHHVLGALGSIIG